MSSTASSAPSSQDFLLEFNNLWHVIKQCEDIMLRMGDNPVLNQHLWVVKAEAMRQIKLLEGDK